MEGTGDNELYARLMAIKPDGLTLNAWAIHAGVSRTFFNDVRKRGNARHDSLLKILGAVGVSLGDFEAGHVRVRTEVRGTGIHDVHRTFRGAEPLAALPLYGSAVGGEYGNVDEHIELTELHLSEVLDYLARPASLATDRDAYALTIVGDSMEPRYKPGEKVAVSPRSSVGIGDDVIVQLLGADGEDERIKMVLIKELVRRTGSHVELRQYNPPGTFLIPREQVAAMHKVKGHYL